jgi:hypothetical protein
MRNTAVRFLLRIRPRRFVAAIVLGLIVIAAVALPKALSAASGGPVATSSPSYSEIAAGRFKYHPTSGRAVLGLPYSYRLYVHCKPNLGTGPDFDGSFWDLESGASSRLADPYDEGKIELTNDGHAKYTSQVTGVVLVFSRHLGDQVVSSCS